MPHLNVLRVTLITLAEQLDWEAATALARATFPNESQHSQAARGLVGLGEHMNYGDAMAARRKCPPREDATWKRHGQLCTNGMALLQLDTAGLHKVWPAIDDGGHAFRRTHTGHSQKWKVAARAKHAEFEHDELVAATKKTGQVALWAAAIEEIISGMPLMQPSVMKTAALTLATSIPAGNAADSQDSVKCAIEMAIIKLQWRVLWIFEEHNVMSKEDAGSGYTHCRSAVPRVDASTLVMAGRIEYSSLEDAVLAFIQHMPQRVKGTDASLPTSWEMARALCADMLQKLRPAGYRQ